MTHCGYPKNWAGSGLDGHRHVRHERSGGYEPDATGVPKDKGPHAHHVYERGVSQGSPASGRIGISAQGCGLPRIGLAIKTVRRGETYVTPAMAKFALYAYCRQDDGSASPLGKLTGRQRETFQLIAEGRSTNQIAHRLDLSVKTVETHRAQLLERLEIHDVPGLVRLAIRTGLVRSDMVRNNKCLDSFPLCVLAVSH